MARATTDDSTICIIKIYKPQPLDVKTLAYITNLHVFVM
jgi:hypothetical protein